MVTAAAAPRSAHAARQEWGRLSAPAWPASHATFDPAMVADLPEPARRWLLHVLPVGTPLCGSVRLRMRGALKLGTWRPFTATQVITPPRGYVWAARTRVHGLPVVGYDRWSSGTGEMRWRVLGLVPVLSARGPDVARSGAGRLAAEMVLAPTAFRGATWTPGSDADRVVARWEIGGDTQRVELHLGPDGTLLDVLVQRWGQPAGMPFGSYPFGVTVTAERRFGGVLLPAELRAGWWWGTDRQDEGEFFRARITAATFQEGT